MTLRDARIIGSQAVCWNCPCHLGQIGMTTFDNGDEPQPTLAAQAVYRLAPLPPEAAAAGIRSVLVIPRRIRDRLRLTGMPFGNRRNPRVNAKGEIPKPGSTFVPLPALLPCWRPQCGAPNRVG